MAMTERLLNVLGFFRWSIVMLRPRRHHEVLKSAGRYNTRNSGTNPLKIDITNIYKLFVSVFVATAVRVPSIISIHLTGCLCGSAGRLRRDGGMFG